MELITAISLLSRDGTDLVTVDADVQNGNSFMKDTNSVMLLAMFSLEPCVVTVSVGEKVDGLPVAARQFALTPGVVKLWTVSNAYKQEDGNVLVHVSAPAKLAAYAF